MEWFYESNGERKGPVDQAVIGDLIRANVVTRTSMVWSQGLPDWVPVLDTELRVHFPADVPPPLSGARIDNSVAWVLAFAPLIGGFIEAMVAGDTGKRIWGITLGLNLGLSYLDAKRLTAAGHDTSKFSGWAWLVPVYLYQRAQATKQNLAYFAVWLICFVLSLGM